MNDPTAHERRLAYATTVPDSGLIHAARSAAGLTQAQAAEMVRVGAYQRWAEYERGIQPMDPARWELFCIKIGRHPMYRPMEGVPVPKKAEPVRSVAEAVKAVTRRKS